MTSPAPSTVYSGQASLSFRAFRGPIIRTSTTSSIITTSSYLDSVTIIRLLDGTTTYVTFRYGGAFMAGVHAAGVLMTDTFWRLTLVEVEEGLADGWVSLDSLAKMGKRAITAPPAKTGVGSEGKIEEVDDAASTSTGDGGKKL